MTMTRLDELPVLTAAGFDSDFVGVAGVSPFGTVCPNAANEHATHTAPPKMKLRIFIAREIAQTAKETFADCRKRLCE